MPIYEYECGECGHEVELWQKITEKPAKTCPNCGARKLQRLISNTSFQLKGTGWYVTDYANKRSSSPSTSQGKSKPAKTSKKASSESSSTSKDS